MDPLVINIEKETVENNFYRRVVFTGKHQQTVLMSLLSEEDIPLEVHDGDQFIRVEKGQALVRLNGKEWILYDGDSVNIPAGTHHYVKNTGSDDLKLYTIYCPPEHSSTRIEWTDPLTYKRQVIRE